MTTKLLVLAAIFVVSGAAELPEYIPGRLVSRGVSPRAFKDADTQCGEANQIGVLCSSNNCETALMCDANGNGLEIPCTASAKYCEFSDADKIGFCTPTQPDRCKDTPLQPGNFLCNSKGFFPDPTNCELYYYCTGPRIEPFVYDCEPGYAYDINKGACKKRIYPSDCATLICKPGDKFITYAPNRAYYAMCGTDQTSVMKCPDEVYQVFNTVTFKCEISCKAEGNQEDRFNCHGYNYCYKTGTTWSYTSNKCPPHPSSVPGTTTLMTFNTVTKKCDPELPAACTNAIII